MRKTQWLLTGVTFMNSCMLIISLMHLGRVRAEDETPVIRARALQILDEQGRVRAELKVSPPVMSQDNKTVSYPEAVELRFLNSSGTTVAGFAGTENGGEVALKGEFGEVHVNTRQPPPLISTNTLAGWPKR